MIRQQVIRLIVPRDQQHQVLREDGVDDLPRVGRPPVGARVATQGASVGVAIQLPPDSHSLIFPGVPSLFLCLSNYATQFISLHRFADDRVRILPPTEEKHAQERQTQPRNDR